MDRTSLLRAWLDCIVCLRKFRRHGMPLDPELPPGTGVCPLCANHYVQAQGDPVSAQKHRGRYT